MGGRDLLPASIRSDASFNVYPQFPRIEDRVTSLKDFFTASAKVLLTQCLLHKDLGHLKSTHKRHHHHNQYATTQISEVTNKLNVWPKQKDQTSMFMDSINHYSFLSLCIIHNQAKESSFLSRYTLYRKNYFSS